MAEGNGRAVTARELNDKLATVDEKISKTRWELRAWMLALVLGLLVKFQVPQTAAYTIHHLF